MIQELVGSCTACKKPIYCNDGFINGNVLEDKTLLCFECFDKEHEQSPEGNI